MRVRNFAFAIVFVCPPFLKKIMLKWLGGAKIGRHVHIGWFSTISGGHIEIGDYTEVRAFSVIRCAGEVRIGAYAVISNFVMIYGAGSFILGNHSYIGPQCWINADEEVRIGSTSALGPRCMVFTHGSFLPYTEGYWAKLAGVTIGDYVWMAAGVFIHPGVEVGNNVFVNSRSVLTQNIPAGEIVEGFPAKSVGSTEKLRRRMTPKRKDEAAWYMLEQFSELILRRRMGLEVQNHTPNRLGFRHRGRQYIMLCIPSNGALPAMEELNSNAHLILMVNRPDWAPPKTRNDLIMFDLTKMKTGPWRDGVHKELWKFMRMYFGVTFEHDA
jgi:acetyltransferase-like isoleucine patch superfamily enzyme